MKRKLLFAPILSAIFMMAISSCAISNSQNPGVDPINPDPTDPVDPVNPDPVEASIKDPNFAPVIRNSVEEVEYTDLFNLNNKVSINIEIDKSELQLIQEDNNRGKKPEMYRLAKKVTINLVNGDNTFTWEFDKVGIRQKGNTSREDIFKNDKVNNHNHFKLSFDETFTDTSMYDSSYIEKNGDESLKDREFLGMSGLDFKWNKNDDSTYVKEIYASHMYRSVGIMYQHIGLSTVTMKTEDGEIADFGVCNIFEQTSKSIIKRTLSDGDEYINMPNWKTEKKGTFGVPDKSYGDFYKVTYGHGNGASNSGGDLSSDSIRGKKVGVKTDVYGNDFPAYERKTNKDEDYSDTLLKTMVNTINGQDYSKIDEVVDLKYFAIEEAVAFYLGNPDSFRYNYNNYMMYFRRTDGKMVVLPIDSDRVFGIGKDWDKGITFGASSNVTPLYKGDVWNNDTHNKLFKKTLFSSTKNDCQDIFKEYISSLRTSKWVKNETFISLYNVAKNTYEDIASFSLEGGKDNISFERFMNVKVEAAKNLNIRNAGSSLS